MASASSENHIKPGKNHLRRELGVGDAAMMGLGSILGTGIFVSIGIAAGVAGPAIIIAIILAAGVATCNALSSAQCAAAHPVSGGTYEYGYKYLRSEAGFLAGWMFLLAKSASAATAALGFSGYLLTAFSISGISATLLAFTTVVILTGIVLSGIRRSSMANTVIVSFTIISLVSFIIVASLYSFAYADTNNFIPFFNGNSNGEIISNILQATALMFVAYTGYGRIATMAEEVKEPERTIPRAIIFTLIVSALLYVLVSASGIAAVGANFLSMAIEGNAAPLESAAKVFEYPILPWLVAAGAAMAMLGVLLNLLLGLSRVLLAMGRRGDMPTLVTIIDSKGSPLVAVLIIGGVVAGLSLIGSVKTIWSFSAFTVLVYYAVTNAAALALPKEYRLYPRWISVVGLVACLFLAFWVEWQIWLVGIGLAVAGLIWQSILRTSKTLN